jgi:transcriptional regulator of acetoin/glycerol metabolism
LEFLMEQSWPGNVRELRTLMMRAAVCAPEPSITADDLRMLAGKQSDPSAGNGDLRQALERSGWNIQRAAGELGVARSTVYLRMKARGITRPVVQCQRMLGYGPDPDMSESVGHV